MPTLSPDQFPVLYHGQHTEEPIKAIRETGMRPVAPHVLFPARWPTLTTSREQAEHYGRHVVEVHLTSEQAAEHLHPAVEHNAWVPATGYAVRKHIPPEHIR